MNTDILYISWIFAAAMMFVAWLIQVRTKNAGYVDAFWALGIMCCTVMYATTGAGDTRIRIIVGLIGGLWFLRLGGYLLLRVMSESEDGRYKAIRNKMGNKTNVFHFFFFMFQATLVGLCSYPMYVVAQNPEPNTLFVILAILIAVTAFIGEYQADHQLDMFRKDPHNKGKTCRVGLWKYSRHPNYFFEWLHWFAYPLLAIGAPYAGWLWLSPIIMWLFLYYITGIPYTEQQALKSRGDDYREYQRTTSAFIPLPPKH